jgi:hypothetical protein
MFEEIVRDEIINSGWTIILFGQPYAKTEAVQKEWTSPCGFKFQKVKINEIQYPSRLCESV